ncbi:MAG: efflux RND transporter permease subunit [Planctomycetota bacterium]
MVAVSRRAAAGWIAVHLVIASLAMMRLGGATTDTSAHVFLAPDDPVRQRYDAFRKAFGEDPFLIVTGPATGLRELPCVVSVLPLGGERSLVRLRDRMPAVVDAIDEACRRNGATYAGELALRVALDREAESIARTLLPFGVLAMGFLLWLSYRSLAVTLAVLLTTGVGVAWGMAIVVAAPLNLVTVLLPVLLLALGTALCIHLVHAYRRSGDVEAMIRMTVRPCLATTLTTAAGFGSFGFARIEPLRMLGIAMAAGIFGMFILAFTLLPALLVWFRPRPKDGLPIGRWLESRVPPLVEHTGFVLGVSLLMVVAAIAMAPFIPQETNALRYLPADHPLRVETERLQEAGFGPTSVEYHLPALPPDLLVTTDRLGKLGQPVRNVLSPASLPAAAMRGFLDPETKAVRISVRTDFIGVEEYDALRPRLRAIIDEEPTGGVALMMTVQGELMKTLFRSLAGTALVILVVLAISLRSLRAAIITLVPAAVPLAFVVLASAVLDIPISIATVMVLAVTLGIVTDDSVHVAHAWRQGLPLPAVLRKVGTAVTETSLAIALGFLACVFTGFLPTRHFGLLTGGAMFMALFADLVLFPVLLRRTMRTHAGVAQR